jgi:hypothetical protein
VHAEDHTTVLQDDARQEMGTIRASPRPENLQWGAAMATNKARTDPQTAATVDRITRDLLDQLELQTRVVLNLLERAPEAQREAHLKRLADLRGRLVRLRNEMLGGGRPTLATAAKGDTQDEPA